MITYARATLVIAVLVVAVPLAECSDAPEPAAGFNLGWRFARGDQAGAVEPDFDDSTWHTVDLPHDWAIAGPFDPAIGGSTGMLPWQGEGWYRKRFTLPTDSEAKGHRVILIFDGVMADPKVFLNGRPVGSWRYGYNSFWIDATAAARFGSENVLAVHADTRQHGSRWYPGGGTYRKVTLRLANPVHIPVWGVCVTTPRVTDDAAEVRVRTQVVNRHRRPTFQDGTHPPPLAIELETVLLDPDGKQVASARSPLSILADTGPSEVEQSLIVKHPERWDVERPCLYTARSVVRFGDDVLDTATTTFGVRTFQWTADDGFHLNGRRVQLYGVNLHHAHGPLGAAFFPRAMQRQLEIMKGMGVNALRTSHNAPAPEVLDLCDRMGIVVFNELFDKYGPTAGQQCTTAEYVDQYAEAEVRNFVLRDRNHPSVFLWSIGNEIPDILGNKDGHAPQHVARMVDYFKRHDTTRPTTMGAHVPASAQPGKHIWDALDTSGWNYSEKYMTARATYPEMPLIYSESASAFSTRGSYKLVMPKSKTDWGTDGLLTAYELTAAAWADIPEKEFERMRRHTFVAGEFVWTGFDYLGEPTPVRGNDKTADGREARSSYFGIVDLVGLPKDRYYLYRSHWRPDETTIHVSPHWNWADSSAERIPVFVYTNGDEAELFVNGESQGRRKKLDPDMLVTDNLAFGARAFASSEELKQDASGNVQEENFAAKAVDGVSSTRWCAADDTLPQSWQVDLGSAKTFRYLAIRWESWAKNYTFGVETSVDGKTWSKLGAAPVNNEYMSRLALPPTPARHVRITVTATKQNRWASIREVEIKESPEQIANPYYDVVDAYRLRWADVPYVPGELKAVAYKDGGRLGQSIVKTAGPPAALRLAADRDQIRGDGMDLCYVTVEMLDAAGTVCPLAMNKVTFTVEGPATLVGVGNGDQLGTDSFTDNAHPLFNGKAVAILRSRAGAEGTFTLTAAAKGVRRAVVAVGCRTAQ